MTELTQEAEYMALYLLKKVVGEAESEYKAKYTDGDIKLRAGERKAVFVDTPDGEIDLGGITRSKPNPAWKVTDEAKFTRWVEENLPAAIMYVPVVSETVKMQLLAEAKANGAAVTADGEEIPGIEQTPGTSFVAPKPSKDALDRLQALVSSGQIQWGQVLPQVGRQEDAA